MDLDTERGKRVEGNHVGGKKLEQSLWETTRKKKRKERKWATDETSS